MPEMRVGKMHHIVRNCMPLCIVLIIRTDLMCIIPVKSHSSHWYYTIAVHISYENGLHIVANVRWRLSILNQSEFNIIKRIYDPLLSYDSPYWVPYIYLIMAWICFFLHQSWIHFIESLFILIVCNSQLVIVSPFVLSHYFFQATVSYFKLNVLV